MALHQPSGRTSRGLALAATTMVLWGSLPLALQATLRELDPVTLTAARFLAAAAVLAAVLARRGELPRLSQLARGQVLLLLFAIATLTANFLGFLTGLDHTSPADAQVMIQLAPLLLGLGGLVIFGERYTRLQWIGVAAIAAGLALFFQGQLAAAGGERERFLTGHSLLLFAAVTWAGYGLAQKQLLHTLRSQPLMCVIYLGCGIALLPGSDPGRILALTPLGALLLAYCAANTLLGYGAFAAALEHVEASRVSAVLALTPVATLLFSQLSGWLWPHAFEQGALGASAWAGGMAVVVGSMAASLGGRRQPGVSRL
jgi:drug/metabolite transporter (DMT)-like permease